MGPMRAIIIDLARWNKMDCCERFWVFPVILSNKIFQRLGLRIALRQNVLSL